MSDTWPQLMEKFMWAVIIACSGFALYERGRRVGAEEAERVVVERLALLNTELTDE